MSSTSEVELLNEVAAAVADSVYRYVMRRIRAKRIRDVLVSVSVRDPSRLLFEIEVNIVTDPLVRDEELKRVSDEAVSYGFKLLDHIIAKIREGGSVSIRDLVGELRMAGQSEAEKEGS